MKRKSKIIVGIITLMMIVGLQHGMAQESRKITLQEAINLSYGHVEERTINFTIPDGYTINNLNDIKINQVYQDNGELTMGFVSGYEMKGNVLSIHITEEYRKTFYPISQFDQFRKIINASSDFNKVVLVLQKKG